MLFLALKKVQIFKITPPLVITTCYTSPPTKFLIHPPTPPLAAIWKTLQPTVFPFLGEPVYTG